MKSFLITDMPEKLDIPADYIRKGTKIGGKCQLRNIPRPYLGNFEGLEVLCV